MVSVLEDVPNILGFSGWQNGLRLGQLDTNAVVFPVHLDAISRSEIGSLVVLRALTSKAPFFDETFHPNNCDVI